VKDLRSDDRVEYTSMESKAYLAGKGIEHQLIFKDDQNRME